MESSKSEEEILRILYALPYFKTFVLGGADPTAIMKTAIISKLGKDSIPRKTSGFRWEAEREKSLRTAIHLVLTECVNRHKKH